MANGFPQSLCTGHLDQGGEGVTINDAHLAERCPDFHASVNALNLHLLWMIISWASTVDQCWAKHFPLGV